MDIDIRSIGTLIDDLITTSNKLWHMQDAVDSGKLSDEEVANTFRKVQTLNVRRNALINAIDRRLDPNIFSFTEKTYK